jgi:TatA/E family protein of Tat protein translocase
MLGSIGFPELIMVFIVVLLVFGPKKLPEFARLLGKTVREFRSTVDEAKAAIENEIYKEGLGPEVQDMRRDIQQALDVYQDIDKPIRDIGRGVRDALTLGGDSGGEAPGTAKEKDEKKDEKSE